MARSALPFVLISTLAGHAAAGDEPSTPPSTFIEVEMVLITGGMGTATLARELVLESDSDWDDLDADFREWILSDLRDRALARKGKG